ncbi:MAG: signal peptidase II [Myxococcota bacterium]
MDDTPPAAPTWQQRLLCPRNLVFLAVLAVGVGLDQASKAWVVAHLDPLVDEIPIVPGWFSIVHAQNTGAAFSTMEGQLGLFLAFTLVAVAVVPWLLRGQPRDARFMPLILGMILSGAVGNGIDRLRQGYVTDFAKAYAGVEPLRSMFIDRFHTNVWPIFNVADSLLLVGVLLFGLYWALQREGEVLDEETSPEAA